MKAKFVLGVGAQKAGTTWLYKTLQSQKFCDMGIMKEYHVWDAKFSDLGKLYKAPLDNLNDARAAMRLRMQDSDEFYGAYFKGLTNKAAYLKGFINRRTTVTGDITPSYSCLDATAFKHMKGVLEKFEFDIKVIFLMRDPVERVWSAIRMGRRRKTRQGIPTDDDILFENFLKNLESHHWERSNYLATIENLESVFDKESIHYEIYEDLFCQRSVESLQDFLGCKIHGIDFKKRINSSPQTPLPNEIIKAAKDRLSDQYRFCNEKFPKTKELWL